MNDLKVNRTHLYQALTLRRQWVELHEIMMIVGFGVLAKGLIHALYWRKNYREPTRDFRSHGIEVLGINSKEAVNILKGGAEVSLPIFRRSWLVLINHVSLQLNKVVDGLVRLTWHSITHRNKFDDPFVIAYDLFVTKKVIGINKWLGVMVRHIVLPR